MAARSETLDLSKLPPPAVGAVDFARDIQPLFERACVKCHGPEKQKSGFRLDQKADALKGGDNYAPAIIPQKSADSPLIHLVAGLEPEMKMPPKGEPLTAAEIGLLRAWIDRGATWPGDASSVQKAAHWSFRPVTRPAIPDGANAIDHLIARLLGEKGLAPSAPADRRTLIRRVYFDVTGLPPAPEEVATFVTDERVDAYEKLVEQLLASPQYGERWSRHWLDVVRFAETNGFETNTPRRNAWPYRDYVIRAFNDDKPFDRFILEQLAGDALGEDAATGFIVGGAWDEVKSPDPGLTANQRADELHDMVSTATSAFLGLTVGCARCHNHKFDPIPQVDYYAIKACFAGVQHGERKLQVPKASDGDREVAQRREQLASVERQLSAFEPLAEVSAAPERARLRPAVDPRKNTERFAPVAAKRLRFTVTQTMDAEPCIDELEVFTAEENSRNVALASEGTKSKASSVFPNSELHRLEHLNDGRYGNGRSWISNERGKGSVELEFPQTTTIARVVWGRDREVKFTDRLATQYRIEVATTADDWKLVASSVDRERYVPGKKSGVFAAPASLTAEERVRFNALLKERNEHLEQVARLANAPAVYAGTFAKPEPIFRLHRGDPMQPRDEIAPGALSTLPIKFNLADASSPSARRLALAQWIASPENPLTARVIANRVWQYHFGEGLVSTSSDFGANGARPSHPELLDWLSSELVAHGWSLKHLHRLILNSATYQQSAAPRLDALAADASTRLLWRFPPRRLEAEPIRDTILRVSGKLDLTSGGPGYSTFKKNDNYVRVYDPLDDFGPEQWRRMIYMTKVRMQQDATFGVFDCPDGGQIAPRRTQSTTPLQALNLFNSRFLMQQAEFFAERLTREAGTDAPAQVQRAFQLAFGRAAAPEEIEAARKLIGEHGLPLFCRALFNANEFVYVF